MTAKQIPIHHTCIYIYIYFSLYVNIFSEQIYKYILPIRYDALIPLAAGQLAKTCELDLSVDRLSGKEKYAIAGALKSTTTSIDVDNSIVEIRFLKTEWYDEKIQKAICRCVAVIRSRKKLLLDAMARTARSLATNASVSDTDLSTSMKKQGLQKCIQNPQIRSAIMMKVSSLRCANGKGEVSPSPNDTKRGGYQ